MKVSLIWMAAEFIIATPITAIDARGLTRERRQQMSRLCGKLIREVQRDSDDSVVCGVLRPELFFLSLQSQFCTELPVYDMTANQFVRNRLFLLIEMPYRKRSASSTLLEELC